MIHKPVDGVFTFECDACSKALATGESGWDAAKAVFVREGWAHRRGPGWWSDLVWDECAACRARCMPWWADRDPAGTRDPSLRRCINEGLRKA